MRNQGLAFVIMQIGNKDLDEIFLSTFVPAIEAANLIARRIDKDNEGKLLKSEIVENIEKADIIIADLTNERPNCYLEIGYAMGIGKYKNLIITAKEDHFPESPNYKQGGPKIHFDLAGYEILFWDPKKLSEFKKNLTEKITRRLSIITPKAGIKERPLWDMEFLESQRIHVMVNLKMREFKRQMEVLISPVNTQLNISQSDLLEISDHAQIETFGWPIAVVFINVPNMRPTPKSDGIISEIHGDVSGKSYDYTYFRKNGQIFISKSLFEDQNAQKSILPDVRLKRMTELLMYVSRFYSKCNLPVNEKIKITVTYTGLLDNFIGNQDGITRHQQRTSKEDKSTIEILTSISEIETRLPELVKEFLDGLFVLFDYFSLNIEYIRFKVDEFVNETNRLIRTNQK